MKSIFTRSMSILLVLLMVVAIVPVTAGATSRATAATVTIGSDGYSATSDYDTIYVDTAKLTNSNLSTYIGLKGGTDAAYSLTLKSDVTVPTSLTSPATAIVLVMNNETQISVLTFNIYPDITEVDYELTVSLISDSGNGKTDFSYDTATGGNTWSETIAKKSASEGFTAIASIVPSDDNVNLSVALSKENITSGLTGTQTITCTVTVASTKDETPTSKYTVAKASVPLSLSIENPDLGTITLAGGTGGTISSPTIYVGDGTGSKDLMSATASINRTGATFIPSFAFSVSTNTTSATNGGAWTVSKAVASTASGATAVLSSTTSLTPTVTVYPKLDGTTTSIPVTLTFVNGTSKETKDVIVTVTVTKGSVDPACNTSLTVSPTNGVATVGSYAAITTTSAFTNYSSMSATQVGQFTYYVTNLTTNNGKFYTSTSKTGEVTASNTVGRSFTSYPAIYYFPTEASTSTSDYDSITITVNNGSAVLKTYTVTFTAETSGYDFSKYDSDDDVYLYVSKTYSSSSSNSTLYGYATEFSIDDFGSYFDDVDTSDYDDYYIMVSPYATLSNSSSDDVMALGHLYNGSSSLVTTSTKIELADIDDDDFKYARTAEGVDAFKFTLYDDSKKAVSGCKNIVMWIINDNSLINGKTPTIIDTTEITYEDKEIDVGTKMDKAYLCDDTLDYITITSLPDSKCGKLTYNGDDVSVGDQIDSKFSKLKFEPDNSDDDIYDKDGYVIAEFTWNVMSKKKENTASADAKTYIMCFEKKSDYQDAVVSGSFRVYTDGNFTFSSDYLNAAFATNDNDTTIKYMYISELPDNGDLYYEGSKITSKDKAIPFASISSLVYKPDDDDDVDDEFDYYMATAASTASGTDLETYEGTVTILQADAASSTTGAGKWTATTTLYPFYTVSNLTVKEESDTGSTTKVKTISYTITEAEVKDMVKNCKSGSTLTIVLTPKSGSTAARRTLVLPKSLFTSTNIAKIPTIVLSEGSTGATISLDTKTLYNAGANSSNVTITLTSATLTTKANSVVSNSISNFDTARVLSIKVGTKEVSFTGNGDAVISIPYSSTSSSKDMAVMYEKNGETYDAIVASEYTGTAIKADIDGSGTFFPAINNVSFTDTAGNWGWTRGYIPSLAARGVINGYAVNGVADGTYRPGNSVTRAEYIKLLITSLCLENKSANCSFSDVQGKWMYEYVAAAVQLGIVETGATFRPDEAITRKDMALYSYRAAKAANLSLPNNTATTTFRDSAEITGEYSSAISAMQAAGIINGMAGEHEGYFLPNGSTDRAAAAKIIWFLSAYLYGWSTSGRN